MKRVYNTVCWMVVLFVIGCYSDKGNYDYTLQPIPEISGIDVNYKNYIGEKLQIQPVIEYGDKEIKNPAYKWIINSEIVSTERDLDVFLSFKTGKKFLSTYTIIDSETGVETSKKFTVEVESKMKDGWLILSNKQNKVQLSFQRHDGVFYENIYKDINGEELDGEGVKLREHWYSMMQSELGQLLIICKGTPNNSVELDGTSFKKVVYTREEFVDEKVPNKFVPIDAHFVGSTNMVLTEDGKIYLRNVDNPAGGSSYQSGNYSNIPLYGDYKLSEWSMSYNHFRGMRYVISYDKKNKRYVVILNGVVNSLKIAQATELGEIAFNVTNMDKEVFAGGIYYGQYIDRYVTFLKGVNDGQYYVQRFQSNDFKYGSEFSTISENIFPDQSLLNDDSKFAVCKDVNYLYLTSNSKLYRYNHDSNTVVFVKDYGKKIISMSIGGNNNELGLALAGNEFIVVNPSATGLGEILSKQIGKFGDIVEVVWKYGKLPSPY